MKHINLYIVILILLLNACAVKNTAQKNNESLDKDESQFIYFFYEANKNRLLGNNKVAVEQYISAIDINSKSAASNFYLATIFIIDKQFESAKTFAEKAVKLQPKNVWYKLAYADILRTQGKTEQAESIYENLNKEFPKNELIYDRLKEIYKNNKNYNKLIDLYTKKQKHFYFESGTSLILYDLYIKQKEFIKAEKTLKNLIQQEPDDPKYSALLAEFYLSSKQLKKAEPIYNELIKSFPENISVRLSYAFYCKLLGDKEEYFLNVRYLVNSELEFLTKVNLLISGQYPNFPKKEYLQLLKELIENHPNEILANTLLAEYYIDDVNKKKAIKFIKKAVDLSNSDFNLLLTLFELYYDEKEFEQLYTDSEKFLLIFPNQPKVFLYNGIAAYHIKKYKEAVNTFHLGKDMIIDDNNLLVQFYYYLAESYHFLNDHKKSDENFEIAIKKKNNFFLAKNSYSKYLSKRNKNITKALNLAKKCIEHSPTNPYYINTYALALLKNNDLQQARKYSEDALTGIPKNNDFLEIHGDILFTLNKKDDALQYWKRSVDNGNESAKIKYKIKNIETITINDL